MWMFPMFSAASPALQFVLSTWTTSRKSSTGSSRSSGPVTRPGLQYRTSRFPDRGETVGSSGSSATRITSTFKIWNNFKFSSSGRGRVQATVRLQTTSLRFSFLTRRWRSSSRILWWMKLFPPSTTGPASPGPPAGKHILTCRSFLVICGITSWKSQDRVRPSGKKVQA